MPPAIIEKGEGRHLVLLLDQTLGRNISVFSKTESVAMPVTASTGSSSARRLPKMLIVCVCVKKMSRRRPRFRLNLNFRMSRM